MRVFSGQLESATKLIRLAIVPFLDRELASLRHSLHSQLLRVLQELLDVDLPRCVVLAD